MVYLIIGIAILLIIVPIFAVLPSAKQKAQMALRQQAQRAGVNVGLTQINDPQPDQPKYRHCPITLAIRVQAQTVQSIREGS